MNLLVIVAVFVFPLAAFGLDDNLLSEIQLSPIEANVPSAERFEKLLLRGLGVYFGNRAGTKLEYEMLRDGPTQSGVSYPKFYLWVVRSSLDGLDEGALRIAAIDRKRFEITDFLSAEDIRENPDILKAVFPAPLIPAILHKVGRSQ